MPTHPNIDPCPDCEGVSEVINSREFYEQWKREQYDKMAREELELLTGAPDAVFREMRAAVYRRFWTEHPGLSGEGPNA